jgi:LPXTG-motif cell wall-anchored protein
MDATLTMHQRLTVVTAVLVLIAAFGFVAVPVHASGQDADANHVAFWEDHFGPGTTCVKYEGAALDGHVSEDGTTWTPYDPDAVIIVKAGSSQSNDGEDPNAEGVSTGGKEISHVIECLVPESTTSSTSETPEEPEDPEDPETPNTPVTPETPEEPETPETHETPDAPAVSTQEILGSSIEATEEVEEVAEVIVVSADDDDAEVLGIELLPETGADSDLLVLIGLAMLMLGSAFVWVSNGETEVAHP